MAQKYSIASAVKIKERTSVFFGILICRIKKKDACSECFLLASGEGDLLKPPLHPGNIFLIEGKKCSFAP
jgi:hypothetical protein